MRQALFTLSGAPSNTSHLDNSISSISSFGKPSELMPAVFLPHEELHTNILTLFSFTYSFSCFPSMNLFLCV